MGASKWILAALLLAPGAALGASTGHYPPAGADIHDTESLQRGARNYLTYCLACHSAHYLRWSRMQEDLGLPEDEIKGYLAATGGKPHDTLASPMPADQAVIMFGIAPPDLSLMARARGLNYLSAFLHGYYLDPTHRNGANNLVQHNTAMPHILVGLQGMPNPVTEEVVRNGKTEQHVVGTEPGAPGMMSAEEYDGFVRDTVNFLDYMSEPVKAKRERLGYWMVPLMLLFWLLAWLLKREYWKDIEEKEA